MSKKAGCITIFIFLCIIGAISNYIDDNKVIKQDYNDIKVIVENKDYLNAQEKIEVFLADNSDSKYIDEVESIQQSIKPEIERIQADKLAAKEKDEAEFEVSLAKLLEDKKKADAELEVSLANKMEDEEKAEADSIMNGMTSEAGVTEKAITNMLDACEKIGMETSGILFTASARNWSNGKMCQFECDGYDFVIYFNENETVYSISSGSIKFYDNSKKISNLSDRIVSTSELQMLVYAAKKDVKDVLKSPTTADFPGGFFSLYKEWECSKNFDEYTVSSYVDSQNSFGAIVRSEFTIKYKSNDGKSFTIISFVFDGERIV